MDVTENKAVGAGLRISPRSTVILDRGAKHQSRNKANMKREKPKLSPQAEQSLSLALSDADFIVSGVTRTPSPKTLAQWHRELASGIFKLGTPEPRNMVAFAYGVLWLRLLAQGKPEDARNIFRLCDERLW